jgi:hypothetical protein
MTMRSISTLLAVGLALAACNRNTPANAVVSSAQPADLTGGAILPPAPSSALPAAAVNAGADEQPTQGGQCTQTTVKTVGTRLDNTPGSGSAIGYANGGAQVSYDQVPGIDDSQAGDSVKLCLVSLPQDCPAGDDRGKVYAATNLRTGETWSEADSEHSCGGA